MVRFDIEVMHHPPMRRSRLGTRKGPTATLRWDPPSWQLTDGVYENKTGVTCLNVTFARLAVVQPPLSGV